MTTIFGTNNLTPGTATYPSNLLTGPSPDLTTGLLIYPASDALTDHVMMLIVTEAGTPMFEVREDGLHYYNLRAGAIYGVFQSQACLNGTEDPPCLDYGGSVAKPRRWMGTGAPSADTVGTARVGDRYHRRDTPTVAGQRVYICTVAGSPGTWVGIA